MSSEIISSTYYKVSNTARLRKIIWPLSSADQVMPGMAILMLGLGPFSVKSLMN